LVFFLPSSTAGWLNGLMPSISPTNATASSKVWISWPIDSSSSFSRVNERFGTFFASIAFDVPIFSAWRIWLNVSFPTR